MNQTTEILSVELLDQHRPLVEALKRLAASLGLEFGWHYLLDLTWIISGLGTVKGKHILGRRRDGPVAIEQALANRP